MDVAITELEKIEADRIDGVGMPANGIPVLLLKQVAGPAAAEPDEPAGPAGDAPAFDHAAALAVVKAIVGRKVDESPDIAGGTAVLAQIADLIIAEAQELKAGNASEIDDIQQLACAAEMIWCWRTGEEAVASGSVQPATALMQSAAGAADWTDGQWAEWVTELQKAIPGAAGVVSILTPSPGPLDDDTAKSQIAPEETSVDTVTQTGDLTEVVKAAVAEANASLVKEIADLKAARDLDRAELAKVKATPVPTGMVLSRNVQVKAPGGAADEDLLAKAALYRAKAEAATAPSDREGYLALARETEQAARTQSA